MKSSFAANSSSGGKDVFDPLGLASKNEPKIEKEDKGSPKAGLTNLSNLPPPSVVKSKTVFEHGTGWDDDDWNFDDLDKPSAAKKNDFSEIDISSKEYKNKNLNKLNDY